MRSFQHMVTRAFHRAPLAPREDIQANRTPIWECTSDQEKAVVAIIKGLEDDMRAHVFLYYGMNGQGAMPLGRICALSNRSLANVAALLDASHLLFRNNRKNRATGHAALLAALGQSAFFLAEDAARLRATGASASDEASLVSNWMKQQKPLHRFLIEALFDHPLDFACVSLSFQGDQHCPSTALSFALDQEEQETLSDGERVLDKAACAGSRDAKIRG